MRVHVAYVPALVLAPWILALTDQVFRDFLIMYAAGLLEAAGLVTL
jgi:hypothetical protein